MPGKKVNASSEIDVDRLLEEPDDGTENDEGQDEGNNEEDGDESPDEGNEEDGDGGEDEGPDGSGEDDEGAEEELEASGGGGANSRSRRASRIRNLSKRLKEATARGSEVEELRRKVEELTNRQQPTQKQESAEEEAAKMALMTPEERIDYKIDKADKAQQRRLQQMQFQSNDNTDRQLFETLKLSNPLARKFSDRVEKEHRDLVSKGQYAGRSVILKYIVGEEAMKAVGGRKVSQQKKNGQRNIDRNRQNNGGQRSDVQANRQRGGKSLEERLEGKSI